MVKSFFQELLINLAIIGTLGLTVLVLELHRIEFCKNIVKCFISYVGLDSL